MSEDKKCPICESVMKNKIWSSYDEPPENLDQCDNCGFTEYYSYYEGHSTYMETYVRTDDGFEKKVVMLADGKEDFIRSDELKELLVQKLKEKGESIETYIQAQREHHERKRLEKQARTQKKIDDQNRWKEENYNEQELTVIQNFLSNQSYTIEKLKEIGVIKNVDRVYKEERLTEIKFTVDEKENTKYTNKKEQAQNDYCVKNKIPMFAPSDCFSCLRSVFGIKTGGKDLFGKIYETISDPISLEKASTSLITGCPHCNRSFVD